MKTQSSTSIDPDKIVIDHQSTVEHFIADVFKIWNFREEQFTIGSSKNYKRSIEQFMIDCLHDVYSEEDFISIDVYYAYVHAAHVHASNGPLS